MTLQSVHGGYNKSHMVELSMTFELPEYSMQRYGYIQHVLVSLNPIQESIKFTGADALFKNGGRRVQGGSGPPPPAQIGDPAAFLNWCFFQKTNMTRNFHPTSLINNFSHNRCVRIINEAVPL